MTQQPKTPLTLDVIDGVDDMTDGAVMVCALGSKPASAAGLDIQFVSGTCSQCKADIHFSVSAPTGIPKVCVSCGLSGGQPDGMAITQQTLDELLEILGLPDTPEIRDLLKDRFLKGIASQIERRLHDE